MIVRLSLGWRWRVILVQIIRDADVPVARESERGFGHYFRKQPLPRQRWGESIKSYSARTQHPSASTNPSLPRRHTRGRRTWCFFILSFFFFDNLVQKSPSAAWRGTLPVPSASSRWFPCHHCTTRFSFLNFFCCCFPRHTSAPPKRVKVSGRRRSNHREEFAERPAVSTPPRGDPPVADWKLAWTIQPPQNKRNKSRPEGSRRVWASSTCL